MRCSKTRGTGTGLSSRCTITRGGGTGTPGTNTDGDDCNPFDSNRPLNKNVNANERRLQQEYWWEYINHFGTRVDYYTYDYSLTGHDYLYGEHPNATFSGPLKINMITIMPQDALLLSKFGLQTNSDIQAIVAIKDFKDVFGIDAEPKSGDLIKLTEAGWRADEIPASGCNILAAVPPGEYTTSIPITSFVRCPQLFEITERTWQDHSLNVNTLLGHYVWVIKGKRFDYSYQPGITPECRDGVVGDDTLTGILTGGTQDPSLQNPSPEKPYPGNADDDTKDNVWDYNDGDTTRNTNPYGEY